MEHRTVRLDAGKRVLIVGATPNDVAWLSNPADRGPEPWIVLAGTLVEPFIPGQALFRQSPRRRRREGRGSRRLAHHRDRPQRSRRARRDPLRGGRGPRRPRRLPRARDALLADAAGRRRDHQEGREAGLRLGLALGACLAPGRRRRLRHHQPLRRPGSQPRSPLTIAGPTSCRTGFLFPALTARPRARMMTVFFHAKEGDGRCER